MNDTRYADAAIAQLAKKHDRPFLLACGVFHPHMPWYVPQKYIDMFPLDEVAAPAILANDLDDVPPLGEAITRGKAKFVDQVMEHGVHKEGVAPTSRRPPTPTPRWAGCWMPWSRANTATTRS